MISNKEKRDIILNKINNIDAMIISFTNNAVICAEKYSLEEELIKCNARKTALLDQLESLIEP